MCSREVDDRDQARFPLPADAPQEWLELTPGSSSAGGPCPLCSSH
jgi:hypothetical protein